MRYQEGAGVEKDPAEAVKWFRNAAEQGHAAAQNSLAICYDKGIGTAQNQPEAVNWWRIAAENGDAAAQVSFGDCLDTGNGVTEDSSEAAKWFRAAAEQGHAAAQFKLGICYDEGRGIAPDAAEAARWYRKSADQDYSDAIEELSPWMPTPLPSSPVAAKSLFCPPWTQIMQLPTAKAVIFHEELISLLKRQPADAAYSITPNIPLKKLQNASTALSIWPFDEILALYDLTMFGSAKYSIAYCKNAVYWQDEVLGFHTAGPYRVDYCQMFNLTIGYGEVYVGSEPLKVP